MSEKATSVDSRNPKHGWIMPSVGDLIINDARDGLNVEAIAQRRRVSPSKVRDILARARRFEFITGDEASALGILDARERAA